MFIFEETTDVDNINQAKILIKETHTYEGEVEEIEVGHFTIELFDEDEWMLVLRPDEDGSCIMLNIDQLLQLSVKLKELNSRIELRRAAFRKFHNC